VELDACGGVEEGVLGMASRDFKQETSASNRDSLVKLMVSDCIIIVDQWHAEPTCVTTHDWAKKLNLNLFRLFDPKFEDERVDPFLTVSFFPSGPKLSPRNCK
jgi:hypothetical protein